MRCLRVQVLQLLFGLLLLQAYESMGRAGEVILSYFLFQMAL